MKHVKKFAVLLLAAVMLLCLTLPAFATEASDPTETTAATEPTEPTETKPGVITLSSAVSGHDYSVYKLFDLTYHAGTSDASYSYTYQEGTAWDGFFIDSDPEDNVTPGGLEYVTINKNGNVAWNVDENTTQDAQAAAFARAALAYAKANGIVPFATKTADGSGVVEFTALDLGYYLVDSSLGALCGLTSASPTASISEKNGQPYVMKEVQEGETWGDWNDASIGDTVNFRTSVIVKSGAENYHLHDEMDAGLTLLTDSFVVTHYKCSGYAEDGTALYEETGTPIASSAEVEGVTVTNWTYVDHSAEDDCTFGIIFDNAFMNTLSPDDKLVVTYSATLNSNAVVGGSGNLNKTWLEFGDKGKTSEDITVTYTWQFDVLKKNSGATPLADASFTLSTDKEGKNLVHFTRKDATKEIPERAADYDTYVHDPKGAVTEITTDATGKFYLEGLDAGTYYLTETKAPAGYNLLTAPIEIVIHSSNKTTGTGVLEGIYEQINVNGTGLTTTLTVEVLNESGGTLPSTGGIGTTVFYVVGSVLLVGAAVLLITKKRMSASK